MNAVEQTGTQDPQRRQPPAGASAPDQPISIYQVHLASWMRVPEEQNRPLSGAEIAPKLAAHAGSMQFTHIQIRPIAGLDPQEIGRLIDHLHQRDLGVILETSPPLSGVKSADSNDAGDGLCADGETRLSNYSYQWDRQWVEEISAYFALDPINRSARQGQFRNRDRYAFGANYILPLSHLLVTHPRPSLLAAMPGDVWQKFANLRLLFAYMFLLPGKKLVFMGNEFGQQNPWQPETSLDWHLLNGGSLHDQLMHCVANLNRFYRGERALHQTDAWAQGFQWIDTADADLSVVAFLRRNADQNEVLLAVLNFTPVPRHNYRVGAPQGGFWSEVFNSDALEFGGSGQGNLGGVEASPFGWHFQSHSLMLTLPPLAAIVLRQPT